MSTELRIGDTEREAAVAALSEHFAAGRLSKEEYDERTAAAFTARTSGTLAHLFVDLPAPHASPTAVSTTAPVTSPDPAPWPRSRNLAPRQAAWWSAATIPGIALLVALAIASQIPWFVAAIVAWVWCVRMVHATRHRSRPHPWRHHGHPPWRHHGHPQWHQPVRR